MAATTDWSALRLKDRIAPGVRVLFVGINPGVRSAQTGHHFAGYSNRFWRLLWDARLVPEPITHEDDLRLPEWGFGITNLIARPSPGIDDLKPAEYVAGWTTVERKIARYGPETVALVGVTLYRAWLAEARRRAAAKSRPWPAEARTMATARRRLGATRLTVHGARLFVLPNPSGRNANFTYDEMLTAFRRLRTFTPARRARG